LDNNTKYRTRQSSSQIAASQEKKATILARESRLCMIYNMTDVRNCLFYELLLPMTKESSNHPVLLAVPVSTVDGALLYSIRQANPEQRSWGRSEPTRNSIYYVLNHQEGYLSGAGDAGSILFWAAGNQTYMEQTPPPQPTGQDALAYVLDHSSRTRNHQLAQQHELPNAGKQLVESILNYAVANEKKNIDFGREIPISVLKEFCEAIQIVIKSALNEEPNQDVEELSEKLHLCIEKALSEWAHKRYPRLEPEPGPIQSLWRKFISGWMEDDESTPLVCIQVLTPEEQIKYGIEEIRALMHQTIQLVYRTRKEYHDQIVGVFLELVKARAARPQKSEEAVDDQVRAKPRRPKEGQPLWLQIEDRGQEREILHLWLENMPAKEIALQLNISTDRVYNIISDLRRRYGEAFVPYRDEKRRRKAST
jgi:hypothetical protein